MPKESRLDSSVALAAACNFMSVASAKESSYAEIARKAEEKKGGRDSGRLKAERQVAKQTSVSFYVRQISNLSLILTLKPT